ncbi:MAG TPA: hypothetical protein VGF53_08100 [Pseudolabrys sp.]|jgi:hypothetical protein
MLANTAEMQGANGADNTRLPRVKLLTLDALDGRTVAARRAKALIEAIEADLGGGAQLTEGARQLVQRAAVLGAYIEDFEARWIGGEPFEATEYLSAINAQRRVLATIGLERRSRDVSPPTLADIAAEINAEKHEERAP